MRVAQHVEAACARSLRTCCLVSAGYRKNGSLFPYAAGLRAAKRSVYKESKEFSGIVKFKMNPLPPIFSYIIKEKVRPRYVIGWQPR
jgi:hypothetical protein